LFARLEQRVREAERGGVRSRAQHGRAAGHLGPRVVGSGVASRWEAAVRLRRRQHHRSRAALREGPAGARGGARASTDDGLARGETAVGEHPTAMAVTKDGKRLFVACANTNAVYAIDVASQRASEQISIALFPNAPPGSTPNGVSLSSDEKRLLVANADNNTVAVVDVEKPGNSQVDGFIPTGWYPTGAMFSRDDARIFVLSGKGLTSTPNPRGNQAGIGGTDGQYIGAMLSGTLSLVGTPT